LLIVPLPVVTVDDANGEKRNKAVEQVDTVDLKIASLHIDDPHDDLEPDEDLSDPGEDPQGTAP
jgi:hypothetical protein